MSVFVGRVCTRVYEYLHLYSVSEKKHLFYLKKKNCQSYMGQEIFMAWLCRADRSCA
jgi:hypothetical protein